MQIVYGRVEAVPLVEVKTYYDRVRKGVDRLERAIRGDDPVEYWRALSEVKRYTRHENVRTLSVDGRSGGRMV